MAWGESKVWMQGSEHDPLYAKLLQDAGAACLEQKPGAAL